MAGLIKRIDLELQAKHTEKAFQILFIPLGFGTAASRMAASRQAWNGLLKRDPLKVCGEVNHPASRAFAIYCWTYDQPDLGLVQTGLELSIPAANASALKDGLFTAEFLDTEPAPFPVRPRDVWTGDVLGGRFGGWSFS